MKQNYIYKFCQHIGLSYMVDACTNIWAVLHLSANSLGSVSAMISLWIQMEISFPRKKHSEPDLRNAVFYGTHEFISSKRLPSKFYTLPDIHIYNKRCVKNGWFEGHGILYLLCPILSFFICQGLWINPSATKWPPTYPALALNCLKFTFSLTGWFMNILFSFLSRNVNYIQQENSWWD